MEVFFYANANGGNILLKKGDGFFRRHLQYLNRQVAVQLGGVWIGRLKTCLMCRLRFADGC